MIVFSYRNFKPYASMKFFKCSVIFILIHFTLNAQQSFDPGYIVKNAQDTVRGSNCSGIKQRSDSFS